jgi:GNAT superfamily N-acetyltransferase
MEWLDNVAWHALTGPQARFAAGGAGARRYASGFSPIVAFGDLQRPDFAALRGCVAPGERFYCADWAGAVPDGWDLHVETTMHQMVWHGSLPDILESAAGAPRIEPLAPRHVDAMLALVELTRPGPFGPRTIELGDYVGCFDEHDGRLLAMAGERMHAGPLRELSGVCTHPSAQGRGLARALLVTLLRRALHRGETPFLHVMRDNLGAIALYERMGFRRVRETSVRVLSGSC